MSILARHANVDDSAEYVELVISPTAILRYLGVSTKQVYEGKVELTLSFREGLSSQGAMESTQPRMPNVSWLVGDGWLDYLMFWSGGYRILGF